MIDSYDTDSTPDAERPDPEQDRPDSIDAAEARVRALHRMSHRFGQRIRQTRGATRPYINLMK